MVCASGDSPDVFDDQVDGFETEIENGDITPDNKISTPDGKDELIYNFKLTKPDLADTFPMSFEAIVDTKSDGPYDVQFILEPKDGGDPITYTVSTLNIMSFTFVNVNQF